VSLPSAVTLGSLGFVLVAGVGLVAASADAVHGSGSQQPAAAPATATHHAPTTTHRDRPASPTRAVPTRKPHKKAAPRANPNAVPNVLVEVYNNTTITGLAAQKAAVLQDAGWNVAAVANWYGNIPADTVYYPPHMKNAAQKLAHTLHITRLRPAVAPMQFDRLTVIFATG
jgi:hypothetical protein